MKLIYGFFFFLFFYAVVHAQNGVKYYLNKDKNPVENPSDAAFYRIINYTESGKPLGMVYDFYLTDTLQFEGLLSAVQPDKYEGTCTWYYPNGLKQRETYYLNGQPAGRMTEWNQEGKTLYEGAFKNGKQWGRHIFWDENGNFSEVAFYHDGQQLNITDLFTSAPQTPADTRQTINTLSEAMQYRFLKDAADAFAFNNFGQIMFEQRKYAQALCLYFVSKEIREILSMPGPLSEVNANIAAVYTATGDTKTAEIYYKKAGIKPQSDTSPQTNEAYFAVNTKPKDRNQALSAYQESIIQTEELLKENKQRESPQHTVSLKDIAKQENYSEQPAQPEMQSSGNNLADAESKKADVHTVKPAQPETETSGNNLADAEIIKADVHTVKPAQPEMPSSENNLADAESIKADVHTVKPLQSKEETSGKTAAAVPVTLKDEAKTHQNTPVTATVANQAATAKATPVLIETTPVSNSLQLPGQQQLIAALEQYLTSQDKGNLVQTLSEQLGVNLNNLNLQDSKAISNIMEQLLASGAYTGITAAFDMNSAAFKATNNNLETQAVILQGLGKAYEEQQLHVQALAAYEQAAKITRNKPQLAAANTAALTGMAQVYRTRQDYQKSVAVLEELKTGSEKAGNDANLALSHKELGKVQFESGNYDAASLHYKQAAEYYESVANLGAVAAATNAAGAMLTVKGSFAEAESQFKQAKSLAEKLKLNAQIAAIYNNTGVLRQMQGNFSEALVQYQQAADLWKKENNPAAALAVLLNMATLSADMANYQQAYSQYKQFAAQYQQNGRLPNDPLQITLKKPETALLQAIDLAVQLSEPDVAFTLATQHKNRLAAQMLLQPGSETVPTLSPALKAEEIFWQQNIAAMQKQAALPQNAGKQGQLQTTLQNMQTAFGQFKNKLKTEAPQYANLKYADALTIEQIQNILQPDEVLLQYTVTDKQTYVFAIAKTVYQCYPLEASAKLETEVLNFLQQFAPNTETSSKENKKADKKVQDNYAQTASKLYKKILLKVTETGYTANKKLVIIPDGFLHSLPFGILLPDAQKGQQFKDYNYFGKQHVLCYYPSVWEFYQQRTAPAIPLPDSGLLAVSNPTFSAGNAKETGKTASYFDIITGNNTINIPAFEADDMKPVITTFSASGTTLLQQGQASEAKLKQVNWQKYRNIFLGVPVLLNSRFPELSGFALSGAQNNAGLLTLPEFVALQPKADLAVLPYLAPQETGLPVFTGNELFTLQSSLMQNGIPAAVLGLWQLPAKDANRFFAAFYEQLNGGKTKAEALQATQQQFMQSAEQFNPLFWGGFVLYGQ